MSRGSARGRGIPHPPAPASRAPAAHDAFANNTMELEMSTEKNIVPAPPDAATQARVIESLVLRGDLSGLAPADRARYYVQMCEGLGLNPSAQPFAFLRLNGKEVLYTTRGATDQLAAIHRLTREIIDGPKVIDLAGTKLVYCVARATHPNGRVETSTATVPLVDPVNVLMKCETKAKRRVTLSILGLGLLDEMELETIPANVQEPGGGVDFSTLSATPAETAGSREEVRDAQPVEVPAQLAEFYARVAEIELPGEGVAVWMKHRADLAPLLGADREAAWKALCRRVEEVGKMKNAKVWLKKAIAEEDARRGIGGNDGYDPDDGGGAGGGAQGGGGGARANGGAGGGAAKSNGARASVGAVDAADDLDVVDAPGARDTKGQLMETRRQRRERLARINFIPALRDSYARHQTLRGYREDVSRRARQLNALLSNVEIDRWLRDVEARHEAA